MHSHILYSILYDSMYSPLVSPRASWSTMRLWRRVLITCLMHSWDSSLERILARLSWRPEHKLFFFFLMCWVEFYWQLYYDWRIFIIAVLFRCVVHSYWNRNPVWSAWVRDVSYPGSAGTSSRMWPSVYIKLQASLHFSSMARFFNLKK